MNFTSGIFSSKTLISIIYNKYLYLYMEKSGPRKEGDPPSRVDFSKRLYEKKLTPLPKSRAGNSACACSDCLALTEFALLS